MTIKQISDRPFLTTAEVAKILGVGQDKVIDWIGDGSLVAINVARHSGGTRPRWRVAAESLLAFNSSRQSQPAPVPAPRRKRRESEAAYY